MARQWNSELTWEIISVPTSCFVVIAGHPYRYIQGTNQKELCVSLWRMYSIYPIVISFLYRPLRVSPLGPVWALSGQALVLD